MATQTGQSNQQTGTMPGRQDQDSEKDLRQKQDNGNTPPKMSTDVEDEDSAEDVEENVDFEEDELESDELESEEMESDDTDDTDAEDASGEDSETEGQDKV